MGVRENPGAREQPPQIKWGREVRVGLTYITGNQGWLWQEGERRAWEEVGSEMGVGWGWFCFKKRRGRASFYRGRN